jgi:hypothetical protein
MPSFYILGGFYSIRRDENAPLLHCQFPGIATWIDIDEFIAL